jgi:hypothetical protein
MALIHSLIDDSQIKDPHIRAFLHQRTRQWRFSDLTSNPQHCTNLPTFYNQQTDQSPTSIDTSSVMQSTKHISWHESIPAGPASTLTKALHRLVLSITPSASGTTPSPASTTEEETAEWSSGQAAICPTFAGGENPVGECIFTYPPVQHAILSFFQDVAQDPFNYHNPPTLKIYTEAPQPSPDNPLALSPNIDDDTGINFQTLSPQTTPEQVELEEALERLIELRVALTACSDDIPELGKGRAKLERKIAVLETRIENLKTMALGHGGLVAGDVGNEKRGNWKMQVQGVKVPFAVTMVDSELLKAAGLMESAEEGLGMSAGHGTASETGTAQDQRGGDGDGDEKKAFV